MRKRRESGGAPRSERRRGPTGGNGDVDLPDRGRRITSPPSRPMAHGVERDGGPAHEECGGRVVGSAGKRNRSYDSHPLSCLQESRVAYWDVVAISAARTHRGDGPEAYLVTVFAPEPTTWPRARVRPALRRARLDGSAGPGRGGVKLHGLQPRASHGTGPRACADREANSQPDAAKPPSSTSSSRRAGLPTALPIRAKCSNNACFGLTDIPPPLFH
jgi:hypothetical protein